MSADLAALLRDAGIVRALIVDDAYDKVPTAADLRPEEEDWTSFFDDLGEAGHSLLRGRYPAYDDQQPSDLIGDDEFIRVVWSLRDNLNPDVTEPLLSRYVSDQASDWVYLDGLARSLEELGLVVDTAGREFVSAAASADIAFVDLFLGAAQDDRAFRSSVEPLRQVVAARSTTPPLIVLMSRNDRLRDLRDTFRDDAGLQESAFRIINKADLAAKAKLHLTIRRLAMHQEDSRALARFIGAWSSGLAAASERTIRSMRRLDLAAHAHIREVLLRYEGQPAGSYMLDIFDRVLQHELESNRNTIDAANGLATVSADRYPPPYVAKSPDLQSLVFKTLFQHVERLRLAGAECSDVAFGDVLSAGPATSAPSADGSAPQSSMVRHLAAGTVLLVVTPACDLARADGAKRVLMLVGRMSPLTSKTWRYKTGRTSIIELAEDDRRWIEWDYKHVMSLTPAEVRAELVMGSLTTLARMRESPALEHQQKLLSDLGRVGQVAPMPATFAVAVTAYYVDVAGRPAQLKVPALDADGGVCWVGRNQDGHAKLRLSLGEDACDQICAALQAVEPEQLHEGVRPLVESLLASGELLGFLGAGLEPPAESDQGRQPLHLPARRQNGGSMAGAAGGLQRRVIGAITRTSVASLTLKPRDAAETALIITVLDLAPDRAARASDDLAKTDPSASVVDRGH